MDDRELLRRIKDATNLAELIGRSVKLRRQGNAWTGLCPFHAERTPSFNVIPDKGFYHCFGCQKHGDAFTWLMEREGLAFAEAKEQLAKAAGIALPQIRGGRDRAEDGMASRMRSVLEAAQSHFQDMLEKCGAARDYLNRRDIGGAFAREAGLGFAPDAWENMVDLLRRQGHSPELIEQTGLASRGDRGNLYDFLRNRITIPIHDARGRLVAFGGRALGDGQPKYLNTRETQLFKKGETLFGLHRAKGRMRDGALLVEGYFDVLRLHREGLHQAVAPLGTALTEQQLQTVARFSSRKLVLCFDGDQAGQSAAEKALMAALTMGFDVRVLQLPPDEDPDTWCGRLGGDACQETIRNAPDWASFVLDRARAGADMKKISDRMKIFHTFVAFFAHMPRTPENWSLLQSVAAELNIPKHEINRALTHRAASAKKGLPAADSIGSIDSTDALTPPGVGAGVDDLLKPLLLLCGKADGAWQRFKDVPSAWWEHLGGAHILQAIIEGEGDSASLPDRALRTLRGLEAAWANKEGSEITFEKAVYNLEKAYVLREIGLGVMFLKSVWADEDPEAKKRLEERHAQLLRRKSALLREPLR